MAFSELHQLQPENLLKFITQQQKQIMQLTVLVEALEADIRRLKKLPEKTDIKPNTKSPDDAPGNSEDEESATENNDEGNSDASQKRKVKKPNEKTRKQRKPPEVTGRRLIYPLELDMQVGGN